MNDVFAEALYYIPPKIWGKQLLPLSLGHLVLLDTVSSPIINGGQIYLGDMGLFIWICSQEYKQANQSLYDLGTQSKHYDKLAYQFKRWARQIPMDKDEIEHAHILIRDYMNHYTNVPTMWVSKNGTNSAKQTPFSFMIASVLMRELSIDEDKAWNMPVNKAVSYYAAIGEMNGEEIRDPNVEAQDVIKVK